MNELSVTVASWSDREDLVVEIEAGDEDFGLVSYDFEAGKPVLEVYPRMSGGEWRFDLNEVLEVLERASCRILEVSGPISTE